jgi:Transposase DDE domain group 1
MVQDDGPVGLDGVKVVFDDERVVSDAGLMLAATLAARLGIEQLAQRLVRLRAKRPGAGSAGRKIMSLIYAMALGADSIDDCDVLRAGRARRLLGGWVAAPSTLGTFLRAFTFGHVRQLDALLGQALERAWKAGAGPGAGRLVVDVDSFVGEVCGRLKQGAA